MPFLVKKTHQALDPEPCFDSVGTRHNSLLSGGRLPAALSLRIIEPQARPAMIDRRNVLRVALTALASVASTQIARAQAGMSRITAYAFSFGGLAGGSIRLADYTGRPILIVNTASLCGYTPQYAGLQELWAEFGARGLMIVGVPANDFGGQEPGGATEIAETALHQYGVTFPISAKAVVKGPSAHPFYKWAADARPKDVPRWNFHKYLIGRDGYIAEVFPETVEPSDTRLKTAIARALADS
jgi:glutathione peroxidase